MTPSAKILSLASGQIKQTQKWCGAFCLQLVGEQLPDLAGFLKLASSPSWRRVNIARP